jgi:hypothetical protein
LLAWGGIAMCCHAFFLLDYYSEMAGNIKGGKDNFSGYPKGLGGQVAQSKDVIGEAGCVSVMLLNR